MSVCFDLLLALIFLYPYIDQLLIYRVCVTHFFFNLEDGSDNGGTLLMVVPVKLLLLVVVLLVVTVNVLYAMVSPVPQFGRDTADCNDNDGTIRQQRKRQQRIKRRKGWYSY